MAEAMRHRSVFSPRSSNRTCGFTASGSPTGFTSRHTVDCQFGLVSRDDTVARNQLSPCGRAPSEASGYFQVLQAHRQSPILGSFESVPEVRVLSSAGITRPHRSYDPVRLPPGPPCSPRRWRCDLRPERASPDYPDHLSNVPCPIPRWIGTGAYVGCFPIPRGLPRFPGGSASTISLSRPAQTSLALRPAGSLNRPRRPLSRGFETAGYPTAPLVSYQINRQLSGWYLPPLVIRAFGAHWEMRATRIPRKNARAGGGGMNALPPSGLPAACVQDAERPGPRRITACASVAARSGARPNAQGARRPGQPAYFTLAEMRTVPLEVTKDAIGHGRTLYVHALWHTYPLKAAGCANRATWRRDREREQYAAACRRFVRRCGTPAPSDAAPVRQERGQTLKGTILHTAPHYSQRRQTRASHVVLTRVRRRGVGNFEQLAWSRPVRAEARPCDTGVVETPSCSAASRVVNSPRARSC